MMINYFQYEIEIVNQSDYTSGSAYKDFTYENEYLHERELNSMCQHGIIVKENGKIFTSAIISASGGPTGINAQSYSLFNNDLLICCGNNVFSLKLPTLALNWKRKLDTAACLAIHLFNGDFIMHGELTLKRFDVNGNVIWNFLSKDVLVKANGENALKITKDQIEITDWDGAVFILDEYGSPL